MSIKPPRPDSAMGKCATTLCGLERRLLRWQGNFVWACAHACPGIFIRTVPHADTCPWAKQTRLVAKSTCENCHQVSLDILQKFLRLFLWLALHLLTSTRLGLVFFGGAPSGDECPHCEPW